MSDKVVIITGASAGLGEELAKNYAKDGWKIGLIARSEDKLLRLKNELIETYSATVEIKRCDVSNKSQLNDSMESFISLFGRIDCVIANAGVGFSTPGYEPDSDKLDQTIGINLLGAAYTAYAAIPTMVKQKSGQLVVLSSLAGYRGLPEAGAYCASKAGVNALFESMRLDLKKYNISVSVIRPGYIQSNITDRNDYYMPQLMSTKKGVAKIYKAIQKKKKFYCFPKPLGSIVQSLYFWPVWLYDLVFAGVSKKKRDR